MGILRKKQQERERRGMDTDQDRIDGEKVARLLQDGLLNKVYEVQCEREKQFNLISQMMNMSVSSCQPTDRTTSSQKQQDMEQVNGNQAYVQYMMERSMIEDNYCNPNDQQVKRSDPVYLASMASHGVWHPEHHQQLEQQHLQQYQMELQQKRQEQLEHQQQQLDLQQRSCQNQILAEQLGGFVLPNRQPDLI